MTSSRVGFALPFPLTKTIGSSPFMTPFKRSPIPGSGLVAANDTSCERRDGILREASWCAHGVGSRSSLGGAVFRSEHDDLSGGAAGQRRQHDESVGARSHLWLLGSPVLEGQAGHDQQEQQFDDFHDSLPGIRNWDILNCYRWWLMSREKNQHVPLILLIRDHLGCVSLEALGLFLSRSR